MDQVAENPRAVLGGNNPPEEMTAFDAVKINITDLYDEAKLWLDGEAVTEQSQADAINTLKTKIKEAFDAAEAQREIEIKPHQTTVKEIQARYNELIGSNKSITGLAVKAEQACNAALKPFLLELDRQQREKAQLAREAADKLRDEALAAMQARNPANLAQNEEAEKLVKDAKAAEVVANQAGKAKAHAKGEGRATSLRTVYRAVIVDQREAAAWLWSTHSSEVMQLAQEMASKAVNAGSRKLRGFNVIEEKTL